MSGELAALYRLQERMMTSSRNNNDVILRLTLEVHSRGSHIHVHVCRSDCDWESKWNQAIDTLLEVDQGLGIKMNSEQLISTNQDTFSDTREVWQCF